ncbi:TetR/AcrR family transcriptional regulator [Tetragenococcus solitarius]|uniref:TetR/AcrR family transcriptional regulator n=2 Tax=Tetragenococcus solitarius TaxID=71453 RepID=A0ABP6L084_9ENTE
MRDKKNDLDQAAYEVFSENGYKNTNISAIVKRAGIAVGSFYNFYQSKEEIFLNVYVKENDRVRNQLIEQIDWKSEPATVIDQLFDYTLQAISNNKILNEWNKSNISKTLHDYYSGAGVKSYNFHHFLLKKFEEWLNKGNFSEEEKKKVLKVYSLIYYIDTHLSERDFDGYNETLGVLVKYFVRGLFS